MLSGHTDEANGVFSFTSPENNSDLLVVSGSNDCTVRFWTFKEERSLTVLQHNTPQQAKTRVSEVVIYLESDQSKPVFITGCTNGSIYGWSLGDDLEGDLGWLADVHRDQVTSLALYYPHHCMASVAQSPKRAQNHMRTSQSFALLENPLVVSGGRDNAIHVRNLYTGEAVGERLLGHTDAITSVAVYSGGHFRNDNSVEPIAPFIVSASEDNDIRIWSLENRVCLAIIQDHDCDVTSLAIYCPLPGESSPSQTLPVQEEMMPSQSRIQTLLEVNSTEVFSSVDSARKLPPLMHTFNECTTPITKKRRKAEKKGSHYSPHSYQQGSYQQRQGRSSITGSHYPEEMLPVPEENGNAVLIASCSMDGTVRLYDPYGDVIKVILVEKKFFSFVTVMNSAEFPLLAASTLSGMVFVWSLEAPYPCLHVFEAHTDEVCEQ
jgi:WD40 repeat protein